LQTSLGEHVLFGRQAETDALRALLLQARDGHGATVLVIGPGGIGKTSLLRWIEGEAAVYGLMVRWGHCLPGVTDPFFPVDQLFRSAADGNQAEHGAPDIRARALGPQERQPLWVRLAAKNENPSELPLAMVSFSRPTKAKSQPSGSRAPARVLLDYLSILEREVQSTPFVLLLDDFHWADQDSVQALKFLSRNIRNLPVLMAVALSEDEVEDHPFVEVLGDLRREGLVSDIRLNGLDEDAVKQLLESVAQAHIDPAIAKTAISSLIERTGGNPYFLLETVHQLKDGGRIHTVGGNAVFDLPKVESGDSGALPVPESVSGLLNKRLLMLSKHERELLEVAALVGQEFKAAVLKDVLQVSDESMEKMLRKLSAERGLLIQKTGNELHYAFAHALLWETTRNAIPSAKRRELSERLASWMEAHEPAEIEKIATLCHEGRVGKKGLFWTEKAIAMAVQAHAHERIARLFANGLGLMEMDEATTERKVEWGLSVVEQMRRDGAYPQLIEPVVRRLIELEPPELMLCEVLLELVDVSVGHVREARRLLTKVQRSVQLKPGMAAPSLIGRIAAMDAIMLFREGRFDAAGEVARKALSLLPVEDTYFHGLAHHYLGWIDVAMARWDEADWNLEQGLKFTKMGNVGGLLPRMLNLEGAIASNRGDLLKGEEAFARYVEAVREIGQIDGLVTALSNVSLSMAFRGNFDGAEEAAREALRLAETFGLPTEIGIGMHRLGTVRLQKGLPVEALRFFKMAEKVFKEQGDSDYLLELRCDMIEAKGNAGDPAGALKDLADAEKDSNLEVGEVAQLHICKAIFSIATGAKDEARAEIESALVQSRQRKMGYWEGKALLVLACWERRYGSPENATTTQALAEKILKACGVISIMPLIPTAPGDT